MVLTADKIEVATESNALPASDSQHRLHTIADRMLGEALSNGIDYLMFHDRN